MSWKNRIVGHGEQAAVSFMANPLNWRIHPKAQREALTGVLSEVGWVQSVIVNRTTGNVLDGHARIEEALKLGDETPVPFVEVELSEEEEKKILLTLDPISAMAAADKQNLEALLHDIETASAGVQSMLADLAKENNLSLNDEEKDLNDKYTKKVATPIYEITGEMPSIDSLCDYTKTMELIEQINNATCSEHVKQFLRAAASRHTVFNYSKIAEFYADSKSKDKIEKTHDKEVIIKKLLFCYFF